MADENISQELVVSILDKLNDTINEITADVTGQSTKLITSIIEQKKNDGYFSSIALGDNSVRENNISDNAITDKKIKSTCDNLATNIVENKTIDTSTGELKDETGTYVTDFIQVRNADKTIIYNSLYINKWKNSLLWVGYGYDKTTVVKSGLGGAVTGLQRKISINSFSNVYFVRIIGYTNVCKSEDFVVTDTEYKNIDWLRLDANNFTNSLPSYLCNNNICTIRSDNSINLNITPIGEDEETNTVTLTTNKTVMAYVDNSLVQIASSNYTLTKTLGTGDYGLIYNLNAKRVQLVELTEIPNLKCSVISYLYLYKQNMPFIYMLGNDAKMNVTWTHNVEDTTNNKIYETTEKVTDKADDNVFTHNIKASNGNWNNINRVGIDRYNTPYPFILNSTVKAQGMLVSENSDCTMYKGLDKGHGGHLFQGWSKNGQYRCTILNDNRMSDNLPVTAIQNWITKGLAETTDCAYGWIHIGSDDFKIIDEVVDKTDNKNGIYVHPKVSIIGTPLVLEPKELLTTMPQGYAVDKNGDYVIDSTTNKRTKLEQETIEDKNVLQVNIDNDLYFHSAKDGKWHKINQDVEIDTINSTITTIDTNLDTLTSSVDNINNKVESINTALETKDTEVSTINENITNLTNEVNTLKSTVESLQTELEELKTKVGNPTENHKSNNITYDNSTSGLTATDVYSAINELKTMIDNLSTTP